MLESACVQIKWVLATPPSTPYSYTLRDELLSANNYFPFSKCVWEGEALLGGIKPSGVLLLSSLCIGFICEAPLTSMNFIRHKKNATFL